MNIFATPQPITATLTTAGARVRVTATERPDTVVRVEPVDSTDSSNVKVAANTKVDFSAGVLSVKTTKSGDKNGSVAITIELPAGSRLVLNTAWSDVHTDGLLGDCQLSIASGQVHLDRVAAVRGDFSGSEVRIGQATSDVDLSGSSGRFDLDLAEGGVVAKASDCPIRIGRLTGGRAELMNASGGIEVGIGGGTAAVDAESTKGAVRNSVPDDGTGQQVYARTRRDDIVIHQV
jgi:hypothetical protein